MIKLFTEGQENKFYSQVVLSLRLGVLANLRELENNGVSDSDLNVPEVNTGIKLVVTLVMLKENTTRGSKKKPREASYVMGRQVLFATDMSDWNWDLS
jgi:hypothetical protein